MWRCPLSQSYPGKPPKVKDQNEHLLRKLTWQWKITRFNRRYIFKWLSFHCHVSFRGVHTKIQFNTVIEVILIFGNRPMNSEIECYGNRMCVCVTSLETPELSRSCHGHEYSDIKYTKQTGFHAIYIACNCMVVEPPHFKSIVVKMGSSSTLA